MSLEGGFGFLQPIDRSFAARSLEASITLQVPVLLSVIVYADRFMRSVMQAGTKVGLEGVPADVRRGVQEEAALAAVQRKPTGRKRSLLLSETRPRLHPSSISTGNMNMNMNMVSGT